MRVYTRMHVAVVRDLTRSNVGGGAAIRGRGGAGKALHRLF